MADLVGNGILTTDTHGNRISANVGVKAPGGHNATFATAVPGPSPDGIHPSADVGYGYFECSPGPGTITVTKEGFKTQVIDTVFPLPSPSLNVSLESSINPTNPVLKSSICIIGKYPYGPKATRGSDNQPFFMDELDVVGPEYWDTILTDYKARGYNTIDVGPIVANGYDGDYPPTNWVGNADGLVTYLTKCRQMGLRINLVLLPDCAPYYNGRDGWDWDAVERDITPVVSDPRVVALVEEWQLEWECPATNEQYCKAATWARRFVPANQNIWYHPEPDHSAPGMSSEPIDEPTMWRNFVAAAGVNCGIAAQFASRGITDDVLAFESFKRNVWDIIRHCNGYGDWPVIKCWIKEYYAYFLYHTRFGYTEEDAKRWGAEVIAQGSMFGDGGPA